MIIKLTWYNDDTPVFVNSDHITWIERIDKTPEEERKLYDVITEIPYTYVEVYQHGQIQHLKVKETHDEIYEMIRTRENKNETNKKLQ